MAPPGLGDEAPTEKKNEDDTSNLEHRWQLRLLPFMASGIALLGLVYFALGIYSTSGIGVFLREEPSTHVTTRVDDLLANRTKNQLTNADVMQQGLLLLEADTLDRRYKQASALLLSRIWTRQLAFNTGMVLSLIGAIFILGKLTESSSQVDLGAASWKAGITSTSPGLILAFLGVSLMGIALVVQPKIEVTDKAIYFLSTQKEDGKKGQASTGVDPVPIPPTDPDPTEDGTTDASRHK